jgi:hypothetical protein
MCTVFTRPEVKAAWEVHIQDIAQAAEEEGAANSSAHMQICAKFTAKPRAKALSRNNISYTIMPSTKYLDSIDPEWRITVQESWGMPCIAALQVDLDKIDAI